MLLVYSFFFFFYLYDMPDVVFPKCLWFSPSNLSAVSITLCCSLSSISMSSLRWLWGFAEVYCDVTLNSWGKEEPSHHPATDYYDVKSVQTLAGQILMILGREDHMLLIVSNTKCHKNPLSQSGVDTCIQKDMANLIGACWDRCETRVTRTFKGYLHPLKTRVCFWRPHLTDKGKAFALALVLYLPCSLWLKIIRFHQVWLAPVCSKVCKEKRRLNVWTLVSEFRRLFISNTLNRIRTTRQLLCMEIAAIPWHVLAYWALSDERNCF